VFCIAGNTRHLVVSQKISRPADLLYHLTTEKIMKIPPAPSATIV